MNPANNMDKPGDYMITVHRCRVMEILIDQRDEDEKNLYIESLYGRSPGSGTDSRSFLYIGAG